MTPARFAIVLLLFHSVVLAWAFRLGRRWSGADRRCKPVGRWLALLLGDAATLGGVAAAMAVIASVVPNVHDITWFYFSEMVARLLGQAVFGEGTALAAWVGWQQVRAGRLGRSAVLAAGALLLVVVYWDGYRREPQDVVLRTHRLDVALPSPAPPLRILHITDLQTPAIGEREERALRLGLAQHPDLIVLTGDYVQDLMGRPTELRAAADLRRLIDRIGFDAPLGVFATEGDAGPPCGIVFAGSRVRCVVDSSVVVPLPGGESLEIVGLSRASGRLRDPGALSALIETRRRADHRIVISHAPDFVDALPPSARVDLVLAGHTHGGQVALPFFGPLLTASRLPRRYAGGLTQFGAFPLHVSRGLGMERGFAPPVRFWCPPELCVLDVRLSGPPALARVTRLED